MQVNCSLAFLRWIFLRSPHGIAIAIATAIIIVIASVIICSPFGVAIAKATLREKKPYLLLSLIVFLFTFFKMKFLNSELNITFFKQCLEKTG